MARQNTRTRFEKRFVAFVDILGFRDLVKRMAREPKLFATIRDVLKSLEKQSKSFRDYARKHQKAVKETWAKGHVPLSEFAPKSRLEMSAFSDCYVISETFPAWHVVAAVQALGSSLLEKGIMTRGAVVLGPAYHKGRVLFGPAINEAYELETKVAKYPRILITEPVRTVAWGYHTGLCKGRLFIRDIDGCWFLNVFIPPLSKWTALSNTTAQTSETKFLINVRDWLERDLQHADGDLLRSSALRWIGHYFNLAAEQGGRIDPLRFPRERKPQSS